MSIYLTPAQVTQVATTVNQSNVAAITSALNAAMDQFSINTTNTRVRYFLSQLAFESMDFNVTVENLNYSAVRLVQVWPSRFTAASAPAYANNPVALGNYVYANRYGNGDPTTGDGYNFRGRGYIQLTFRGNYTNASNAIYGDTRLISNPDQVANDPNASALTSGWFWQVNNLNTLTDQLNFTAVTTAINGSSVSVPQRRLYLARANVAIV